MSETKTRTAVETVENAVRYSDGTILLKMVRASYPHVLEAQENESDDGKITKSYGIVGLMPKETHDEAKKLVVREMNRILKESNKGEKIPAAKKFLRDGDPKDEDDEGKPEEAGMWIVSARESKRPKVLSNVRDKKTGKAKVLNPDVEEDIAKIYGGCWVNILVRPWFQNNKYGKRLNAGISVVQFRKDDEPFGSGRISDEDAADMGEEGIEDEEDAGGEDDSDEL